MLDQIKTITEVNGPQTVINPITAKITKIKAHIFQLHFLFIHQLVYIFIIHQNPSKVKNYRTKKEGVKGEILEKN
jgi:hypothetical protein